MVAFVLKTFLTSAYIYVEKHTSQVNDFNPVTKHEYGCKYIVVWEVESRVQKCFPYIYKKKNLEKVFPLKFH